ncbi:MULTISPECIES: pyridoxal-phosphate dependent enzyme [unclassified Spirosoma]|uniref:pyridoxal-phosphate dependent enzyme n=1 Tax=unclassified Spirosoma TaxID=2621999 RepID=UPI000AB7AE01|nr:MULTISPECIES: pyridoxal-phosphate dependent enzyme [unclassified Spirosoma]MBN8822351.1 pyridoxal-phosphate dependent enzyme [Spirosoma sp.]
MKTIWTYAEHLPPVPDASRLYLGEGGTPLVKSRYIGKAIGLDHLYFKLENLNPTGSYKDRFASVLVSQMRAAGQTVCLATSSGNTGAALSAYCAAAGIQCVLVVVDGAPLPKIRQMQLYGAEILMVSDFGKSAQVTGHVFAKLTELCQMHQLPLPISAFHYCPSAMQGVQTMVYEIMEQLPQAPNHIFSPAGGGGLTLAMGRGVVSAKAATKVHCVQPEGNDTIASALRWGQEKAIPVDYSTTRISGLQVANVIDGNEVVNTCRQLGGRGYVVTDTEVFNWHQELARREGIFGEPAGAVALTGVVQALRLGELSPSDVVVCPITGSGFKDMNAVERNFGLPDVSAISIAEGLGRIEQFIS